MPFLKYTQFVQISASYSCLAHTSTAAVSLHSLYRTIMYKYILMIHVFNADSAATSSKTQKVRKDPKHYECSFKTCSGHKSLPVFK
jgi:hypothetical protein